MHTLSRGSPSGRPESSRGAGFEPIYRAHVDSVTGFFARRAADAQTVADLTAETFVQAVGSFGSSPPVRGCERPWLFAIARNVYARHCELAARHAHVKRLVAGLGELSESAIEELELRLDAEKAAAELLDRVGRLPAGERAALELVDVDGLSVSEAATALNASLVAVRVRLSRARARLRKEHEP
jgi:RNA polymerase sigma factor (sigma-70 family)